VRPIGCRRNSASVQGVAASTRPAQPAILLPPARQLPRVHGSAHQGKRTRPATERICNRPDLEKLIGELAASPDHLASARLQATTSKRRKEEEASRHALKIS